jgi:hypothetical protein
MKRIRAPIDMSDQALIQLAQTDVPHTLHYQLYQ